MRTADRPDYATILGIVRNWPPVQRFLLVQDVLRALAPSGPPRPAVRNTLERARGLLATNHPPPSADELTSWAYSARQTMRVLLDTDVMLDGLLDRQPWVADAGAIWAACDDGCLDGFVTASSMTDIVYFARRASGLVAARAAVQVRLDAFNISICEVSRQTLEQALILTGRNPVLLSP